MEIRGFRWVAEKHTHACSCLEVACVFIPALKLREIINTERKKRKRKTNGGLI